MALEFKVADFNYPLSLLKLRTEFEKNQWYSREQQTLYQETLLRRTVEQAYGHVPYYRELFDRIRLKPGDVRRVADLEKIPILTKKTLRDEFEKLKADNLRRFHPQSLCTSGTTGNRIEFLADKSSNVLEFVYYWRHWNWAGYRLGNRFAELSSVFFIKHKDKVDPFTCFQRVTNRLLLNSSTISAATVRTYVAAIRKHRPVFLKGLPSTLYYFSLFLREMNIEDITFKAIFSTGEILLPRYRKLIEETFRCKVYNSYGHMERTVAISECPQGSLHINTDYGVLESVNTDGAPCRSVRNGPGASGRAARIIGTSLHSFSMPLIRYEVGDLVQMESAQTCACGREFPVVHSIDGRESEVLMTPEGAVIAAPFLIFEEVPEILAGQIVQESMSELRVRVVPSSRFSSWHEALICSGLRMLVGTTIGITVEQCASLDSLRGESGKIRTVISKLNPVATA